MSLKAGYEDIIIVDLPISGMNTASKFGEKKPHKISLNDIAKSLR